MRECTNPDCAQRHFPRTDPAIIVLVTHKDHCLLGRKPSWPPGLYSTIAGFVEPGECIEHAVQREVREETGIEVTEMHYQSSQPWPFPSSLMLGFRACASSTSICVGKDELEDALWISRDGLRGRLTSGTLRLPTDISISHRLIEGWYNEGHMGLLADVRTRAEEQT
jgi:NAD+ diphosphatase